MCGYCLERAFLDVFEKECRTGSSLTDWPDTLLLEHHAQESSRLRHILHHARTKEMESDIFYVLHCRLLEEKTLRSGNVANDGEIQKSLTESLEAYQNFLSKRFSERLKDLLPDSSWMILYSSDFLFNEQKRNNFIQSETTRFQAVSLLEGYYRWWLKGENKRKNNMSDLLNEKGIADPIEETSGEEWEKFYDLYPAIFFSLVYLVSLGVDLSIVERIALNEPEDTPDFPGYDLWLQRRALMYIIKEKGTAFLIDNLDFLLRPEIVFYTFLRLDSIKRKKYRLIEKLEMLLKKVEINTEFFEQCSSYIDRMKQHLIK